MARYCNNEIGYIHKIIDEYHGKQKNYIFGQIEFLRYFVRRWEETAITDEANNDLDALAERLVELTGQRWYYEGMESEIEY